MDPSAQVGHIGGTKKMQLASILQDFMVPSPHFPLLLAHLSPPLPPHVPLFSASFVKDTRQCRAISKRCGLLYTTRPLV
ncbi:hypothetical protein J6590_043879 [Homalodisca vitripennis]|nr:hypothetical protein J6590_043879 [Homalodisca vitripennis]